MHKLCAIFLVVFLPAPLLAQKSFVNGVIHDGVAINCDLPESQQLKNIGSRVDGAGMCVMSSIEMAARYQGLEHLRGLRDWCARFPGGAYPQKVDQQLARFFKEKGIQPVPYLQYEGKQPESVLELIDRTNRLACITYGQSPRYAGPRNPGGSVSHMVCNVLYRGNYAVVLDNNFIGDKNYEWMTKQELVRRMKMSRSGSAWVFVWLTPGSPPPPKSKKQRG